MFRLDMGNDDTDVKSKRHVVLFQTLKPFSKYLLQVNYRGLCVAHPQSNHHTKLHHLDLLSTLKLSRALHASSEL